MLAFRAFALLACVVQAAIIHKPLTLAVAAPNLTLNGVRVPLENKSTT